MTVVTAQPIDADDLAAGPSRLLVTRRDPDTATYRALGFLTFDGHTYRYAYLRSALKMPGFRPLPGLSDTSHVHASGQLFPIFAERVISARRPDRQTSMDALGLSREAAPFEVLQRNGGRRVGDTIEVLPAPTADANGTLVVDFLVHGVRYQPSEAQERITRLRPGEPLRIVPETDNTSDPRALLVTDRDEVPLGYVPRPLLDVVLRLAGPTVAVVRASGPEVGFHFRLLVRVVGKLTEGDQPFSGPEWELVGQA